MSGNGLELCLLQAVCVVCPGPYLSQVPGGFQLLTSTQVVSLEVPGLLVSACLSLAVSLVTSSWS